MMDWLVYVVGYPGSGKTTAVRGALGSIEVGLDGRRKEVVRKPFAHTIHPCGLVELGCEKDIYGGTDALPLNVQPIVAKWMKDVDIPVIVGEGDRLANRKFFDEACEYNKELQECLSRYLCFVHIKCPELTARKRAWERGSRFNESWLKGRISKVDGLVSAASKPYIHMSEGFYNSSNYKSWKEPVDLTVNVFSTMDGEFHEIDGTQSPEDIALELRTIIEGLNDE